VNSVILGGKEVFYEIRSSRRARRLGLTVYPGGRLVLTLPKRIALNTTNLSVIRFIQSHGQWIAKSLQRFADKRKLPSGAWDYQENRERALLLAQRRLEHFNSHYGLRYERITIRNNRTRWGSCSRKGNLNFSYKIVHLSPELFDYIIVHELCHLRHFDHSAAFWKSVQETIPNYKALQRELRTFVH
jgi:predicted metal-dependent hydrolase